MPVAYRGRILISPPKPSIEDGVIVVNHGQIVQIGGEIPAGVSVVDLNEKNSSTSGGVAILPGLVNAHTHLEFSDLKAPLGEPGMPFPDWIRSVIQYRLNEQSGQRVEMREGRSRIQHGLDECIRSGTTTIGEISKPDAPWTSDASTAPDVAPAASLTAFIELLGLGEDRSERATSELDAAQQRLRQQCPRWQMGVSPHAPYSTHWKLVQEMCRYSREHQLPLAMHLAESPEELELLRTHGGPFRQLLDEIGVWNSSAFQLGVTTMEYLQQLATAHRALVIHGNYLNEQEIAFVAKHKERMSVVYCPRTHTYFQHATHPLPRILSTGVNIALGTDSRASTPDLDMMAELRHVAKTHPSLSPEMILPMGTMAGAKALGMADHVGSLEIGKRADLAVFALPNEPNGDALEALLNDSLPCVATVVAGKLYE